jgi:hypothetical protein
VPYLAIKHDVFWLEVTVQDASAVHLSQCQHQLASNNLNFSLWQWRALAMLQYVPQAAVQCLLVNVVVVSSIGSSSSSSASDQSKVRYCVTVVACECTCTHWSVLLTGVTAAIRVSIKCTRGASSLAYIATPTATHLVGCTLSTRQR